MPEAVVYLLESASRAEKAAEAVQQFVRPGFDVMDGPVEFAICIDLFLSQEALKLEQFTLRCICLECMITRIVSL